LEKIPEGEPEKVEKRGRPRGTNSKDSNGSPIRSSSNNNNNNNNTTNDTPTPESDAKRGRGRPKKGKTQPKVNEEEPLPPMPNLPPVTQPPVINIPTLQNNFGGFSDFNPGNFANITQTTFVPTLHHPTSNTEDIDYDEED
jgi:hypothetical protein